MYVRHEEQVGSCTSMSDSVNVIEGINQREEDQKRGEAREPANP
jgi:hypothetical protein